MWLTSSSIGRKVVMAVTGLALVLFVTFHVLMNAVALLWPTAYNQVCEFLGANWYALIASVGLAALFIIHIIYAVWLTLQNRAARGVDRYAVTARQPQVEWASKNMLVLGIVVVAFLIVHLIQFWAKMQLQEVMGNGLTELPQLNGAACNPAMGTLFIQAAFSEPWTAIVYVIGFVALWFHMTHGFWSMFHTAGWDNNIWISRLKTIGTWWASIVVVLFIAQAAVFTVLANKNYYTENEALQEQYSEFWGEQAKVVTEDFFKEYMAVVTPAQAGEMSQEDAQAKLEELFLTKGQAYLDRAEAISNGFKAQCPKVAGSEELQQLENFKRSLGQQLMMIQMQKAQAQQPAAAATPDSVANDEAPVEVPEENSTNE